MLLTKRKAGIEMARSVSITKKSVNKNSAINEPLYEIVEEERNSLGFVEDEGVQIRPEGS